MAGAVEPPGVGRLWQGAAAAVGALLLVRIGYAILSLQALAGDGAAVLPRSLLAHGVSNLDPNRIVADALLQWPMVLAARLGVTDFRLLACLLGAGYYYLAPLSLALCWWLVPSDRRQLLLFPLLSLLIGWMGSSFYGLHQANAAALLFWPVLLALLLRPAQRRRDAALLLALALPMIGLYDTVVVLGPLLAGVAGWRWLRQPEARQRWVWAVLVAWFVAAAAIALFFIIEPRNPSNRAGFIRGLLTGAFLWDRRYEALNWPLALGLGAALLLAEAAWRPALFRGRERLWLAPFGAIAAYAALAPLLDPARFTAAPHFAARSISGLLPAALGLLLLAAAARDWRPGADWLRLARPLLTITAVAQLAWHICATAQWAGYLDVFRTALASGRGLVPFETTPLAADRIGLQVLRRQGFGWTTAWLSLDLAPGGRVSAIIDNPDHHAAGSFAPARPSPMFDPARADGLPPLPGLDYTEYLAALPRPQ
ncbi:MAG: hypothetical protein U1E53_19770 [Dongiaceae bacterium]